MFKHRKERDFSSLEEGKHAEPSRGMGEGNEESARRFQLWERQKIVAKAPVQGVGSGNARV